MKEFLIDVWNKIVSLFSKKEVEKQEEQIAEVECKIASEEEILQLEKELKKIVLHRQKSTDEEIIIPVVVHIVHQGEDIGKGSNISDAQIYSAITATNEDFAKAYKTRGDGQGVATPFRIVLANKDDKGNFTTGIYRIDGSKKSSLWKDVGIQSSRSNPGMPESIVKAWSRQNNQHVYNIWVVSKINGGFGGGVQGFAYYPTSAVVDGTVNLYNAFGKRHPDAVTGDSNSYNLKSYTKYNRTLTHELGHALAIPHTFDASSCIPDVDWNYMSYAHENLKNGFAQCQLDRMLLVAAASRKNLVSSTAFDNIAQIQTTADIEILSPLGAACKNSKVPLEVKITNTGDQPIHKMVLEYTIGKEKKTKTWYGAIAPQSIVGNYTMTLQDVPTDKTVDVTVKLLTINDNPSSVVAKRKMTVPTNTPYKLELRQDAIAAQISWEVQDMKGQIMYRSPQYENFKPNIIVTHNLCLPDGKYKVLLKDVVPGFITEGAYIRLLDDKNQQLYKVDTAFSDLVWEFEVGKKPEFNLLTSNIECKGRNVYLTFRTENEQDVAHYEIWSTDKELLSEVFPNKGRYTIELPIRREMFLNVIFKDGNSRILDKYRPDCIPPRAYIEGEVEIDMFANLPNMTIYDDRGRKIGSDISDIREGVYTIVFYETKGYESKISIKTV